MTTFSDPETLNTLDYKNEQLKIVVMGEPSMGKTTFLTRVHKNKFDQKIGPTLSLQYLSYGVVLQKYQTKFKAQIWDTTGQAHYRSLLSGYVNGTHGIFLMISIQKLIPYYKLEDDNSNQSFQKQLSLMTFPLIEFIQNKRSSHHPIIYYFLISKIDLIQSKEQRKILVNKIMKTLNGSIKLWEAMIQSKGSKSSISGFSTYECTKMWDVISSKQMDGQSLRRIIRRMVELVYVQFLVQDIIQVGGCIDQTQSDNIFSILTSIQFKQYESFGQSIQKMFQNLKLKYKRYNYREQRTIQEKQLTNKSQSQSTATESPIKIAFKNKQGQKKSTILSAEGMDKQNKKRKSCC